MKASIIRDYDIEIEIAEFDPPELKDDSVLIAVHAASLNPIDYILQSGAMKEMIPLEFPHIMSIFQPGFQLRSLISDQKCYARYRRPV